MQASDFSLKERYTFEELCELVHFLRSPNGCPWDQVQTHESLRKGLIEEAYEAVQAISVGDMANLREELGDVLLQVIFHADLAAEKHRFTLEDIVSTLCYKLISRHSHVFGEDRAADPAAVKRLWDENKRKEKLQQMNLTGAVSAPDAEDASVVKMKKVTTAAGSLFRANELQKIAAKKGFDWPDAAGAREKILEELQEVEEAKAEDIEEELGDLLFAVVNYVRLHKIDPDIALARANEKFCSRYAKMLAKAQQAGVDFAALSLAEMDVFWDLVKKEEKDEIR